MKIISIICLLLSFIFSQAQQQSFDLFSFNPPKKWNSAEKKNGLIFSTTDQKKQTWAQIDIVKSTTSKGSIEEDFKSEWKELVMDRYAVPGEPLQIDSQTFQGYQVWTGLGKFLVKKDTASVLLNTFSDGYRCASFILLSNTTSYGKLFDEFLASVNIIKQAPPQQNDNDPVNNSTVATTNTGYQFNTTNFDDGWTSVVKENWVEATKGNIKVRLHYPTKQDEVYYTQHDEKMNVFWNMLIAPRYNNLRNYESHSSNLPESAYFAGGLLQEKETGQDVWVTLFSKGKSGWMEIITPDKASFVKAFGIENPNAYYTEWNSLLNLAGMNRFAVGENDLVGKWSNNFTGSTAYYSIYTGLYSGSTNFASAVNYVFAANKTYTWDLAMGRSATGTMMKVDQAKANGNWKMLGNWQIWCSKIEGKPKTYNAYFSCVKGARILWLQDTEYGSYTAYGKINN
jgi:hypothetical protein